ncbi:helix-turn-helix domain-containing protein [Paenibacillus dendritiformis]|uniref:AraC family transcriptional regulator n=1 Tax=Paenibacillus dendritiformis C454 TaxID=1131935 RepID=H3SLB0_9BACL|nr:helix-turn-helix domain-containing protein [Paenibacillus dendritiformis]EHQ60129.1 AraC family transcriptional regulator [Paenibacillus dendritiformis C454]CAH8769529.1 helix-turn-helix domain-containing protein [Paenibacillus dendritiformis]
MNPIRKPRSFQIALFWRHFANYFVIILIPVIVACALAHFLVVSLIEKDAQKLNNVVLSHFSEQTDTALNALKTNMINMLSASNIRSLLKEAGDDSRDNQRRMELIHSLREQLIKLQSDELVTRAYLFFVHHDLVIDADTYTDKAYYFDFRYPMNEAEKTAYLAQFSNKKMMEFTKTDRTSLSALMSYPFNTPLPDVYLVVEVNRDKLKNLIHIRENWVAGTAILESGGDILSENGLVADGIRHLSLPLTTGTSKFLIAEDKAISLVKSRFDDSSFYLSLVDLPTLMKPAQVTRLISWIFLAFFVVVGSFVSYYLSRRIYQPIAEIKEGLKSHRATEPLQLGEGNDYDVIKRYSRLIISENKELSQRVTGMLPVVQEHFVTKIVQGEYRDALSIETYAKEIDFAYAKKAARTVLGIALHFDPKVYGPLSETSKSFLMAELKERMMQLVPSTTWICQMKPDLLACVIHKDPLLNLSPEEDANIIKVALQLYGSYFKATIGIGSTVHGMEELHLSYEHAVSMLQRRGLYADVEICSGQSGWDAPPFETFLSVQDVNRILNQYKTREYDKLLQSAYEMVEEGVRQHATASQIKYLCTDILNTWVRAVETERKDFNVPFYAGWFERVNACMTVEEVKHCFREFHGLLFQSARPDERSRKMTDILAYIHDHYDEELSIEQFAGTMNMSVGHFSRIFKEEVGEKYVEYIAKYRLAKAKELLLQTDLKMDDIAAKVGYWGRNSFIRMFRKYEGITPAKYRALHQ